MTFLHPSWTLPKKCPYSELLWSVFSRIWTEYGEIRGISLFSVRIRENTEQNDSEYGHFSRSGNGELTINCLTKRNPEAVVRRFSLKKVFLKLSQDSQENIWQDMVAHLLKIFFFWKNMFLTKFFNIICRKNVLVWKKSFILKIFFTEKKLYLQIKI